ncbi:hypothetical protein BDN72DRAFT_830297 [Pluteus cervinus]|uniref:Uncharacterized protein n=1 Tax=Pluteus cervinus TaxID=181527 RepID=A0ACD3BGW0_9AGAR|nr:hypothetical protein BDN72DRAFT_830297 [Pluteus cervinus]
MAFRALSLAEGCDVPDRLHNWCLPKSLKSFQLTSVVPLPLPFSRRFSPSLMASSDLSSASASSSSATPLPSLSSTSLSESFLSSKSSMSASSDSRSSLSSSTVSTPSSSPTTSSSTAPPPPSLTSSSSSSSSPTHLSSTTTTSTTPDVTTPSTSPPSQVPETTSSSTTPPPPPPASTSFFAPPPTSTSTFPSPVFITTTDLSGQITTSSPSALTTYLTTTAGDGQPVTVTVVQVNPTLSGPNTGTSGSANSPFFKNTGAVAGVFLLVGLTATSIILWIIFAIRRRRRTRRLDHDTAVSATLAAVGFHRTPLDDDDDPANASHRSRYGSPEAEMMHRSSSAFAVNSISSIPSGARTSGYLDPHTPEGSTHQEQYNPYIDYGGGPPSAYTRTATPSSVAVYGHRTSGSAGDVITSHSASGSYEPLLASYYKPNPDQPQASAPPTPPPRNPRRPSVKNIKEGSQISSPASQSEHGTSVDERLDPGLRNRNQSEESDLKDNEDYSRPVLGVRNLPDGVSQTSHQS